MWNGETETAPSKETYDKAKKYLEEDRVKPAGEAVLYKANGSEEYLVVLQGDDYYCTCPSTTTCSHVLAARRLRDGQWS